MSRESDAIAAIENLAKRNAPLLGVSTQNYANNLRNALGVYDGFDREKLNRALRAFRKLNVELNKSQDRLELWSRLSYVDEFLRMKCATDMMEHKLFPNSKEITESFGAYWAVCNWLDVDRADPDIHIVAVGDGHAPRTAATFAFRSKWMCHSVDPLLRGRESWNDIRRLTVNRMMIEEWRAPQNIKHAVVVAVHSHAKLPASILPLQRAGCQKISIVAMPCCVPLELPGQEPDIEFVDERVASKKNEIRIWSEVV